MGAGGLHDSNGPALAAQPGKSKGRPDNNASSQLIRYFGLPAMRAPDTPIPVDGSYSIHPSQEMRKARRAYSCLIIIGLSRITERSKGVSGRCSALQIHGVSARHFIRHRNDSYDAKATDEVCLQSHAVYRRAVRNPCFIKCDRFKPTTLDDVGNRTQAGVSRRGDVMMYSSLYEAALVLLTGPGRWNPTKAWRRDRPPARNAEGQRCCGTQARDHFSSHVAGSTRISRDEIQIHPTSSMQDHFSASRPHASVKYKPYRARDACLFDECLLDERRWHCARQGPSLPDKPRYRYQQD